MWQVIENTPGYLPDADEPAIFESFADAVSYANTLADELSESGYATDRTYPSSHCYEIVAERSDTVAPDLGRVIIVEEVAE